MNWFYFWMGAAISQVIGAVSFQLMELTTTEPGDRPTLSPVALASLALAVVCVLIMMLTKGAT